MIRLKDENKTISQLENYVRSNNELVYLEKVIDQFYHNYKQDTKDVKYKELINFCLDKYNDYKKNFSSMRSRVLSLYDSTLREINLLNKRTNVRK